MSRRTIHLSRIWKHDLRVALCIFILCKSITFVDDTRRKTGRFIWKKKENIRFDCPERCQYFW